MIRLEDIQKIGKHASEPGYSIEFSDGRSVHITKRRTIIALLILLKEGEATESDIAQGNTKINEIREILGPKLPSSYVQDYYGDANKPFSELWNEEGFSFIDNLKGERRGRSQKYVLNPADHEKLFGKIRKAYRKAPAASVVAEMSVKYGRTCNLCGSTLVDRKGLKKADFSKDRRREVFDHRVPVEKGGDSGESNYQALCFYCNKSKWQVCNICEEEQCDGCALAYPETSKVVKPTGEDIEDRMSAREVE